MMIEWLGRVDWNPEGSWGFKRHRLGFYIKLGHRGVSVWTRNAT